MLLKVVQNTLQKQHPGGDSHSKELPKASKTLMTEFIHEYYS